MDKIQKAYSGTSGIYDGLLTGDSLLGKIYLRLFWGGVDERRITGSVLDMIPEGFSGRILDVPAGTAVFTADRWASLGEAEITCLDYSEDMIEKAGERLSGCPNVTCMQGDVGRLPFGDGSFDIVLSLNGFHAFPDKEKAFSETHRVLRDGGLFLSSFYVKGESRTTDWLARNVLSPRGWFTPPFETVSGLRERLESMYGEVSVRSEGPLVCVYARK